VAVCVFYCRLISRSAARGETRGTSRAPSTSDRLGNNTTEAVDEPDWLYVKWVFAIKLQLKKAHLPF